MCQIIDSEMLVDYVLAKHEVVTAAQLESIRKQSPTCKRCWREIRSTLMAKG